VRPVVAQLGLRLEDKHVEAAIRRALADGDVVDGEAEGWP